MHSVLNDYGVVATYLDSGAINLYTLISPSDDVGLEFDFKDENTIKKLFSKELDQIEQIDLIWYAGTVAN